ncbi:MAG: 30S ribosomal protein S6e, partial [Candidatus Methanomethylophilus sp.]|nr:30S ribosomal protein S6e [Methanomethylophilus sp.]
GERKRVAARGSAISSEIVQINMVIAEYGPKPIEELLNGGEEKTE